MHIPMSSPDITEADVQAVTEVLRTPTLSIGPRLLEFERLVADACDASYGIGVSSGTAGLHIAMVGAGVSDGDYVITTPFSFVASSNAILYQRSIPIFVDVDEKTGNIDPKLVVAAAEDLMNGGIPANTWLPPQLRNGRHGELKAILPVHVFGQPAELDPIIDVATRLGLAVVEDACEALGSTYKGRAVGALGHSGVVAFYPNKQITTGEGGMIVTNDVDLYHLARSLRNQGRDVFDRWLDHTRLGFNYRLDEMSAGLGCSQMTRLDEMVAKRARVAASYGELLAGVEGVIVPSIVPGVDMSWMLYVVRLAPELNRSAIMAALDGWNVPSRAYFPPIHLQPFYSSLFGYEKGMFPIAERLGNSSLALPFSSIMTRDQVEYVCHALVSAIENHQ